MAQATGNCSVTPPVSEVYFNAISVGEKVGIGISTALCVIIIGLFLDQVLFVMNKYQTGLEDKLKVKSIWLLGIYPIFSLASMLAVYVPRSILFSKLAATIYLAVCLFHFTSLIILYAGGITELLHKVDANSNGFNFRSPPLCCCCFCCPVVKASWSTLRKLRIMVFQYALLQPFTSFLTLVMWLDDKYIYRHIAVNEAYIYLEAINVLSTLTGMYGLMVLFHSSKVFLSEQRIRPKFFALLLVILINNIQGFIFVILAKNGYPRCVGILSSAVRGHAFESMLVVVEMFALTILARIFYRRPHILRQNTNASIVSGIKDSHNDILGEGVEVVKEEIEMDAMGVVPSRSTGELTQLDDVEGRYRRMSDAQRSSAKQDSSEYNNAVGWF